MAQDRWGALSERIVMAPPLADAKRARARLAELIERAEGKPEADALLPLLREGRFRDLTAALAYLRANGPSRVALVGASIGGMASGTGAGGGATWS